MDSLRRFMFIMGFLFSFLAAVALGRVVAADGRAIWYVPAVIAFAAIAMFFCAWRLRRPDSSRD
ncbi:MAG: hypothetical protein K2O55_06675 [Alistipes sp.]|nr:hypothetical protein [Alistipes sp.]